MAPVATEVRSRAGRPKGGKNRDKQPVLHAARLILDSEPKAITLRRLFYKLISAGVVENTPKNYEWVGNIVNDTRWEGIISFDSIVDGIRTPLRTSAWKGLKDFSATAVRSYRRDKWEGQDNYIELWVKKAAVVTLLTDVCHQHQVIMRPLHGFNSLTSVHETATELQDIHKNITIFYLGDHDVAGYRIELDAQNRLHRMFEEVLGTRRREALEFIRLGIGVEDLDNPNFEIYPMEVEDENGNGKGGDKDRKARAAFIAKYGNAAAEVDGLPTEEMERRVREAFERSIDWEAWGSIEDEESIEKARLVADLSKY